MKHVGIKKNCKDNHELKKKKMQGSLGDLTTDAVYRLN